MSILASAFREQVKKTKDIAMISEQTHSVCYSTGFLTIDFLNGHILEIDERKYFQIGIVDGSINAVIARSGEGKTTLCAQMAANIIRPFETSCIFFDGAEGGLVLQRGMQLTGFGPEMFRRKCIFRDAGVTTETIYERVKLIHDIKTKDPDKYLYDTGIIDEHGKHVMKFEPTVYVIDSLKTVLPRKLTEDSGTNMNGATTARVNSDIFLRLVPMCKQANIIMLVINHITVGGVASVMPTKAEIAYLKPGESLPGGKTTSQYLQNNIFRLDNKVKLKDSDKWFIDGAIVEVSIVKSRTNKAGKGCRIVFNQEIGYDTDLTLLNFIEEKGLIEGIGANLRIAGLEEVKFSRKNFKEVLYTNETFHKHFVNTCLEHLKADLLERHEKQKAEENIKLGSLANPYEAILSQLQSE